MANTGDDELIGRVREAIGKNPIVSLFDVKVDAIDGVVYLAGVVSSLQAKMAAGAAAASVDGARGVENDISVEADVHHDADREIYEAVSAALETDPAIDASRIGVEVRAGTVTLVGHARSAAEEQAAIAAARRAPGVRDVISSLHIGAGEPLDAISLANHVMDALSRNPSLVGYDLRVEVGKENQVYMRGEVATEAERELAERVASAVPGVQKVVNLIAILTT